MRVLGVDGCKGGWIGADVAAGSVRWLLLPDARSIAEVASAYDAIGIDIPIGLSDSGPRACDTAARRRLPGRASCVFNAPVRPVLAATSYAQACALSRAACGRAISQQTWHITARIRDVDDWLAELPNVVEVHPELSFATLAGAPLPPKRTSGGQVARRQALLAWIGDVQLPAATHDALDALAAAWSASRWARGTAMTIPDDPPTDSRGRPMRMAA